MLGNIVYVLLWVIAPIAPAFVLFKFLKNAGEVSGQGPAHGFQWRLRGAFGGYVFVFLAIALSIHKAITPPSGDKWKTLTVEGWVTVHGPNPDPRMVRFMFRPPSPEIDEVTGHFSIPLQVPADPEPGTPSPYLLVAGDDLSPVTIPLLESQPGPTDGYQATDYKIERLLGDKKILISRKIVLDQLPAHSGDKFAVVPASP